MNSRRWGVRCFAVLLAAGIIAAASATAFAPSGSDFRISNAGTDGDAARNGLTPAVTAGTSVFLAVWTADALTTDNEFEIYARLYSSAGVALRPEFRISTVGTDGDPARDASQPAVAYNPARNVFLVTWTADALTTDNEFEIYGARVNSDGVLLAGGGRISTVGTDTDTARAPGAPSVAAVGDEFLVAWHGDHLADEDNEIRGQRVSAISGSLLGSNFPITAAAVDATNASVASSNAGYLVAWEGASVAGETEIFGTAVTASGLADSEFRISNVGTDGDIERDANDPSATFGPGEFLVTWAGDGLATNDELEIFGQRLEPDGDALGGDFRISNVGTDTDAARDADTPSAAFSDTNLFDADLNEYVVTWSGDGLATNGELEVFGQRLNTKGQEVGSDFPISSVPGDANHDALGSAVAYIEASDSFLTVWQGDPFTNDNEFEAYGHLMTRPAPPAPVVTTQTAANITQSSAQMRGTVDRGNSPTTFWFEYGLTTSYGSKDPIISPPGASVPDGTGAQNVARTVTLNPGTTYHYRIVAVNGSGTTMGGDQSFTTLPLAPVVTTGAASSITDSSAVVAGTINPGGGATTYRFEYGTTTAYGSQAPVPDGSAGSGTSPAAVGAGISGLAASTTYHYRLVGTNASGTVPGADQTFTTAAPPVVQPAVNPECAILRAKLKKAKAKKKKRKIRKRLRALGCP